MLNSFNQMYEQTLLKKTRQRSIRESYKAYLHTSKDKLFYILFYFKSINPATIPKWSIFLTDISSIKDIF